MIGAIAHGEPATALALAMRPFAHLVTYSHPVVPWRSLSIFGGILRNMPGSGAATDNEESDRWFERRPLDFGLLIEVIATLETSLATLRVVPGRNSED